MAFGLDDLRRLMGGDKAGGAKTVAAILNTVGSAEREEILCSIEKEDPALAEEIRALLFVFEDLAGLDARSLREVAREVDQSRLALALRGADPALVDAFCAGMSERQAAMIRDDVEAMGPQRAADVEAARRDVTAAAKRLEAQGRIVLRPGPGDVYI